MELAKFKNGGVIDLDYAHEVIKKNKKEIEVYGKKKMVLFSVEPQGGRRTPPEYLTTSKLRNLLTMVNNLYTQVYNDPSATLSENVRDELSYLKVKFAYEAGRNASVRSFIEKTKVSQLVDHVLKHNTKKYFLDYCKYFEALVAYAKFYKMED
ncbi:type III-A CRISPR-associated protein Csm2 [Enterococcus asini]|uniref:CRISPR system Cms protein Csm2 n=1 Tax=Enterococcus asini TaxID=57732 RepID=A0AAW8TWI7_9ENTE|nr:type III-A CRISPR-associated protein Csm2 [Enterococcus asini]MDT2808914.1 type III-A CRISPR-associated protein Csm2 [Enterococcus asini]